MKVVVRCAHNRVTKADMEREIEKLFQENKDLRLSESHLRLEVNILRQQSEARRQVICERDKLIQELNEEVQASNDELENVQCDLVDHVKLQEEMCDTIDDLRTKIAHACADRDNFEAAYKQVLQWWEAAQSKAVKAEAAADEYRIAAMESDCRVNELEKQLEWARNKNEEWAAVAQDLRNTIEEMKAQKEADDKKSEEICTACNERYEDVLAERNRLREEVARLTTERDTSVSENSELIFTINELQDKWEAEHNLRVEAEKAYDKVASEAYDMHQQITNLTVDNTRLENKVEELEDEVDTCRHNIDGYIEGNRRMRAEYEKKMETEQDQTKYWRKKHDEVLQKMECYKTQLIVSNNENLARAKAMEQMQEEYNELEANFDELEQVHKLWGEEIDRLRKVVTELQTNRFTMGEIQNMIRKYLESFEPSSGSLNF